MMNNQTASNSGLGGMGNGMGGGATNMMYGTGVAVGGMYGMNFMEYIFREIYDKGWEGFKISTLFQVWMYQSMEKFNELFKTGTEKIINFMKSMSEKYLNRIIAYIWAKIMFCYATIICFFTKTDEKPIVKKVVTKVPEPKPDNNTFQFNIDPNNKMDIMALVFETIHHEHFRISESNRKNTSRYNTKLEYTLPGSVSWNIMNPFKVNMETIDSDVSSSTSSITKEEISVCLEQNIDLVGIYEIDKKSSHRLKDITINYEPTETRTCDSFTKEYETFVNTYIKPLGVNRNMFFSHFDSSFSYGCSCGIKYSLFSEEYMWISALIVNDIGLLTNFFKFLMGKHMMWFCGAQIKLEKMSQNDLPCMFTKTINKNNFDEEINKLFE